jgi:hypothetical protein
MNKIARTWEKWWAAGSTLKTEKQYKTQEEIETPDIPTWVLMNAQKCVQRRSQNNMGVDLIAPYFLNWKQ